MKRPQVKYIALLIIIIFLLLFGLAQFVGSSCSAIGGCKQCWDTVSRDVYSDLCPSSDPCWAEAHEMQHNALVDLLLCACKNAKASDYSDENINKQITDVYKVMSGYDIQIQELCDSPSLYLTKWSYG